EEFKNVSFSQLTQLHNVMVKDLSITTGIRSRAVGITGTTYRPLDNSFQIKEALEKTIQAINTSSFPLEKALIAITFISYIQPFTDGNKRTSRMLANAILMAHDYYPLSYRSVDERIFKEALIIFYETHSILHFKKILLDQYQFALDTYFK
ncbi:Fic family protein, partial [Candidatus Daviesbacteria bacterium]|nr:Fic family protein [Candidatus Daviesbacteria bacterium]